MRRFVLPFLFIILLGGCSIMFDSADPKANSPAEPVELYPIGRFVLAVPKALQYSGGWCRVNDINIKEHNWLEKDHAAQWRSAWEPLRDKEKKSFLWRQENKKGSSSGFAEYDLSKVFKEPATTLCYGSKNGAGKHYIDTYLQRPELLLQLQAEVFLNDDDCAKVNVPALQLPLYQAYKYGKENPAPNSFFTEKGRLEGFEAKNERTEVGFSLEFNRQQKITFSFTSRTATSPGLNSLDSMSKVRGLAARWAVDMDTLRSRRRDFNGREGLEEVVIMVDKKEDGDVEAELYAFWQIQGEIGNPQKPYVEIELRARLYEENGSKSIWKKHPEYKDQALRMWKAITDNFTSAEEYYSR